MAVAPTPAEIYARSEEEGRRRLGMSALEQTSTAFIAGVTIVLGIAALGVVEALVEPDVGPGVARVLGALAFGIGLVFLVVGRSELFTENFFGPVAASIDGGLRGGLGILLRLWGFTLALNLVGGAVLVAILTVEGALPSGAPEVLDKVAEEIAGKTAAATLARAVLAGALLTLLSYLLHAVDTVLARIWLALMAGFLVALGPFDHVVVSALHLLFGLWNGAAVTWTELAANLGLSTVGNLVGGVLLMTLTHTAQAKGSR
ncbi:MAG: formate/nitrite transporter family protein [Actinomycetes bacterium]